MNQRLINQFFLFAWILVGLFCVYTVVSSLELRKNTGILHIAASEADAVISISQADRAANAVGTGTADIRLRAGTYQIAASSGSKQAFVKVTITKQQNTNSQLKLTDTPILPTLATIDFINMDKLLDYGVSSAQLQSGEQAFFQFNHNAKKIVVDPSTIAPTPHDRNSASTENSISFGLSIDSIPYRAKLVYYGLNDDTRLYIYNSGAIQVFDSNLGTVQTGD